MNKTAGRKYPRDWKRQYRLSKLRWRYRCIRLDHDDDRALVELAQRRHVSVPELIRTFVAWGLEDEYEGADAD